MAYAYVLVTAGKILDLLPINVTDEPQKKREDSRNTPKDIVSRICSLCKEYKAGTEFYGKGYCKGCNKIYNQWRKYDKMRVKKENEDKVKIRREFFKKQLNEYKQ